MSKENVSMFKFIVVGDQSVGKSCFMKQYSENPLIETSKATIVDKRRVELQIWDAAGQEQFRKSAHEEIVKILVGSKSDLDRYVIKEEAEKFMNTHNFSLFFEISAKTGENVEKVYKKQHFMVMKQ